MGVERQSNPSRIVVVTAALGVQSSGAMQQTLGNSPTTFPGDIINPGTETISTAHMGS